MFQAGSTNLSSLLLSVLAIVIIIIFAGAIVMFFIAIFQFIFSKGEQEKIKKAWNTIRYMILGILFSIVLLIAFPFLIQKLEIDGYQEFNARNIFKRASEIINFMKEDMGGPTRSGSSGSAPLPQQGSDGYIEL